MYSKVEWKNYTPGAPDNTAINQSNLDHMDQGILEAHQFIEVLQAKSQGTLSTDLASSDREGWLNAEHGIYQIQTNGMANGYPANFMILINAKRDTILTTQLAYTSSGLVWTRTVNNNNSVLDWIPVHPVIQKINPIFYGAWKNYSPNFTPLTLIRDGKKRTLIGSINGEAATNKYICGLHAEDRPSKHLFDSTFVNDGGHMVGYLTIATNGDIDITPFKHSHIAINTTWYVD